METPKVSSSEPSTPPSSAAEQARLRKARREAKIKAGGSDRLNKITGLGGSVPREPPQPPQPSANSHDDPEEVDISQHFYQPGANRSRPALSSDTFSAPQQQIDEDQLRQMMLGLTPSGTPPTGTNPFAGFPGAPGMGGQDAAEDPMVKLLQQMMGGGMPGQGTDGMPAFPGMTPGTPGQAEAGGDPYAYLWRIIHAFFALGLGVYIAFTTSFTGTKLERERSGLLSPQLKGEAQTGLSPESVHFFWIFATAEILLQTSRFFLEKGRVQQGGMLGTIMGFLPEPWRGYLALFSRYSRIWTTVSADAMACLFVLGACCWLRST
ncbi:hypothetical protein F5884DRAFT_290622 [Xylogone sp. PMI_703]|nr:hypothetical protein F5884DRAFT_290622 [Xylogone sp. PMI_703]